MFDSGKADGVVWRRGVGAEEGFGRGQRDGVGAEDGVWDVGEGAGCGGVGRKWG